MNDLDYLWKELETRVQLYEYSLRRKYNNLDEIELNEKIRKSVNRKFKKESNFLLQLQIKQYFELFEKC